MYVQPIQLTQVLCFFLLRLSSGAVYQAIPGQARPGYTMPFRCQECKQCIAEMNEKNKMKMKQFKKKMKYEKWKYKIET